MIMNFNVRSGDIDFNLKASRAEPREDGSIDFYIFTGCEFSLCASFKEYDWFVAGEKEIKK